MISLVHGATVVQDADRWLSDAAVAFEGETILAVGPFAELRARWPEALLLGGPGALVMPGLVNAHDHGRGVSTFERGLTDGPLESWRLEQSARPQPAWYGQALYFGLLQMRSGITAFVHMHPTGAPPGKLLEMAGAALQAYKRLGLRVCFALTAWDQNRLVYGDEAAFIEGLPSDLRNQARERLAPPVSLDETVAVARELAQEARGSRVSVYLGPMAPQWCSESMLRALRRAADQLNSGLHMHLLETPYQRLWADRTFGRSVVEVLDEWGIVDERLTVAHGVWLSDHEIELLARRGASLSHNPSSNLRLSNGVARVPAMLARELNVGIGLDGMSLLEPDLFAEMRLALTLGRPPGVNSATLDARSVWRLATQGGSRAALGRSDLGVLEAGRPADLLVLEGKGLFGPFTAVSRDPVEYTLWRGRPDLVQTVIVGGETLLENGQPLVADPSAVAAQLNQELSEIEARSAADRWHIELARHAAQFFADWQIPSEGWTPPVGS